MPDGINPMDYGILVGVLWMIIRDLLAKIKGNGHSPCVKKEDLETIKSHLDDLHRWHNARTENGNFVWWHDGKEVNKKLEEIRTMYGNILDRIRKLSPNKES